MLFYLVTANDDRSIESAAIRISSFVYGNHVLLWKLPNTENRFLLIHNQDQTAFARACFQDPTRFVITDTLSFNHNKHTKIDNNIIEIADLSQINTDQLETTHLFDALKKESLSFVARMAEYQGDGINYLYMSIKTLADFEKACEEGRAIYISPNFKSFKKQEGEWDADKKIVISVRKTQSPSVSPQLNGSSSPPPPSLSLSSSSPSRSYVPPVKSYTPYIPIENDGKGALDDQLLNNEDDQTPFLPNENPSKIRSFLSCCCPCLFSKNASSSLSEGLLASSDTELSESSKRRSALSNLSATNSGG